MKELGKFPFGQPVREILQIDRSPKTVFVLGVYASAVHARWINANNRTVVNSLAVASEPYIFWRGENAESIIGDIHIPQDLGKLVPADPKFNGPSGKALDEKILMPLGIERNDAWLCDLVPHSCANESQIKAVKREYKPIVREFGLLDYSVPLRPSQLTNENRRTEIAEELFASKSLILILLGDDPIKWFLSFYASSWKRLVDFGCDIQSYGKFHNVKICRNEFLILPLAHPRQIAELGKSSPKWTHIHKEWAKQVSNSINLKEHFS